MQEISSFASLVEVFCGQWGPDGHNHWMVIVENFKLWCTNHHLRSPNLPLEDDETLVKQDTKDSKTNQFWTANSSTKIDEIACKQPLITPSSTIEQISTQEKAHNKCEKRQSHDGN